MRQNLITLVKYLIIVNLVIFITNYVIGLGIVHGNSMLPTLVNNQLIVMWKLDPELQKDDIVSFKYAQAQENYTNQLAQQDVSTSKIGEAHIKRIIGLPGDKIDITLNDNNENEIYINNILYQTSKMQVPEQSYILGKDQYFVLGDNREVSFDSLFHGPVNKKEIIGKVVYEFPKPFQR